MKLFTEDLSDFKPWEGANSTMRRIEEEGKEDELEQFIEETYPEGISFSSLNDLLWFESEFVFEMLGIEEEEEEEEED